MNRDVWAAATWDYAGNRLHPDNLPRDIVGIIRGFVQPGLLRTRSSPTRLQLVAKTSRAFIGEIAGTIVTRSTIFTCGHVAVHNTHYCHEPRCSVAAKHAIIHLGDCDITLLFTPRHIYCAWGSVVCEAPDATYRYWTDGRSTCTRHIPKIIRKYYAITPFGVKVQSLLIPNICHHEDCVIWTATSCVQFTVYRACAYTPPLVQANRWQPPNAPCDNNNIEYYVGYDSAGMILAALHRNGDRYYMHMPPTASVAQTNGAVVIEHRSRAGYTWFLLDENTLQPIASWETSERGNLKCSNGNIYMCIGSVINRVCR